MTSRELTKQENKAISKLTALANIWPDSLMLFDHSGSILIVDKTTHQVFTDILGIPSDGGDPGTIYIDGVQYLDL
jgi:hypothetical protein